ncbi:hypothetical protein CC86DRAFT_407160 [Ophiobolus disseminans]|uniref:Uncharacterized protein n=1 Tax=Ophiobolus disseminans TaxID=1469910 RepID=A0A6A7A013_9PLEO|nr:hypothetical protein CC86DRAFT_407160 [Ophiobolus disseminans]
MDDRPPPLLIENADGRPISLGQLITKLHDYTIGLRDLIYEIEDREASDNAHLYFSGLSGPNRRDLEDMDYLFRVHAWSDVVKNDPMDEETWTRKAQHFAAKHHSSSS